MIASQAQLSRVVCSTWFPSEFRVLILFLQFFLNSSVTVGFRFRAWVQRSLCTGSTGQF